ncbi:MAG: DUF1501 domain-containing protein, partial [Pirellulaceae bacterium]
MSLAHLLSEDRRGLSAAGPYNLQPKVPHQASRAKAVIHLFMNGGPSQMDLFDPKPALEEYAGKPFPGEVEEIG